MCMLSAVLLDDTETVHKVEGREVLGVCVGRESYDLWRVCFGPVFAAINQHTKTIQSKPPIMKLKVDGVEYHVELFLGGDYKFLLMILGMNSAMADYSCLWCFVHKVRGRYYRFD